MQVIWLVSEELQVKMTTEQPNDYPWKVPTNLSRGRSQRQS